LGAVEVAVSDADKERYLALMRKEFGSNVIAYHRGYLCCFGLGELPCPHDLGMCETWQGAALAALKAQIRKNVEAQVESEAEAKLRALERAAAPKPADTNRYCSVCKRSNEGAHSSSCNGPDQEWLTREQLVARGGYPR
jgi:hypothetical protein